MGYISRITDDELGSIVLDWTSTFLASHIICSFLLLLWNVWKKYCTHFRVWFTILGCLKVVLSSLSSKRICFMECEMRLIETRNCQYPRVNITSVLYSLTTMTMISYKPQFVCLHPKQNKINLVPGCSKKWNYYY